MPHLPDHLTDHDGLLVAAYAAGDAEGDDLERARALVASCDECAALHHDLRAIAAAMPAIPAPARTRDFRLTQEQAAELRPSGWRRFVASLSAPRFAFAAPLGGGLAALGLAGILVAGAGSAPVAPATTGGSRTAENAPAAAPAVPGANASTAAEQPSAGNVYLAAPVGRSPAAGVQAPDAGATTGPNPAPGGISGTGPAAGGGAPGATGSAVADSGAASPATAASEAPAAAQPAPSAAPALGYADKGDAASTAADAGPVDASSSAATTADAGTPLLPLVSAVLLVAGLALLALGLVARRGRPAA